MTNTKLIHQDYTTFGKVYQVKISSEYEILIPRDESVRLLDAIMEELDYTKMYRAYAVKGRNTAVTPVTMSKILIYGAMDGVYSGRKLERSCRRDINYMWLLGDEPAPSHDALNRFRSGVFADYAEDLFYQLVRKLLYIGEIELAHLFVDGTKLEANANKYSFVWKKSTTKYQARLAAKIAKFYEELNARYDFAFGDETLLSEVMGAFAALPRVPFVHGRGKRKSQMQRNVEQLTELWERNKNMKNIKKRSADATVSPRPTRTRHSCT